MGTTIAPTGRPTIYDVAERAGVSKSLVSLVLRGSPGVSEKRKAAVVAAITELGYRPSQAATLLASTRTRSIEMLIDEYRNLSFVGLAQGIRDTLTGQNIYLTVTETQQHLGPSPAGPYSPATQADGRILAAEPTAAVLAGWTSCPTVVAGHRQGVPADVDVIASDDQLGSRLACEHLVSLGHRNIGHLSGSGGGARHRRIGFLNFMQLSGLEVRIAGEQGGTTEEDGYRSAIEMLTRCPDTTAFVAANDVMALGAMAAIREHGRSVPLDVSVIGYDNTPLAQSRYLSLTTIDDQSSSVGAAAAHALLNRLDDPQATPVYTLIPPDLVIRATTAPVTG